MIIELAVASVLLMVMMSISIELLATAVTQRRAAADQQLATQEAANLMERLAAMPFTDLQSEKVRDLPLSPEGKQLRGVKSDVTITNVDGPPAAAQVVVSIRWEDRDGQLLAPVRLVAWRYP